MTTEQIAEHFDIVWAGKQLLCVYGADHPIRQADPVVQPVAHIHPTHEANRKRVSQALPGTMRELEARTGCQRSVIYAVLEFYRKRNQLISTGPRRPTSYSLTGEARG